MDNKLESKKELLKKIKNIEIKATILSDNIFAGQYQSCLKGNGMEFSDIRRYAPGDDVKKIDWKVTAKQRKAYVKEFVEERELSVFLLVDISASNRFKEKLDLITELVGSLAFSANKNGDRVGALFFSNEIERVIPLKKGKKHTLSIIENLLTINPKGDKTDISMALRYFGKVFKRRSIIFLISDFLDENYEKELKILSQRHEIIPVRIGDKKYESLPIGAIFTLEDAETGEQIVVENYKENSSDININNIYNGINLYVGEDYVKEISKFFNRGRVR
ncbi:DUF58 domain-containing protein [Cetobacterium somerae]|uniref:DUF58 domain-containing protein n=1 Tax=Cetobacterium sp. NK01 TaxID=2993530 RepID=UPI002115F032|nr:DUF58 domain-containing protein [Cetobacterium sp. NK01]MCQ8212818.1 DUF58 domain-containing protein [Cetobacterium sp. NK01]